MSEPLLTTRLHISGLTPSVTPSDLERRLSSFGKVMAMDGFGACDALGEPRKFGFVTIEIDPKQLARCLNVLSGSTWKGAKLRIGEAKPDFRERLAQVNSQPLRPPRPKRMSSRDYGYPSSTLPLTPLSAAAAASTPGWIVTPSGRVVRPMRMRPERPLEPIRCELSTSKFAGVNGKVKKRTKPPLVRARRRLIDPTKWDSVHLKGVFLDAVPAPLSTSKAVLELSGLGKHPTVHVEEGEETSKDGANNDASSTLPQPVRQWFHDGACAISNAHQSPKDPVMISSRIHEATECLDVREEANASLAVLDEMFGDKEEWDGRESVEEMEESEDNEAMDEMRVDKEDDIEVVPRDFGEGERSKNIEDKSKGKEKLGYFVRSGHEDVEAACDEDIEMVQNDPPLSTKVSAQTPEPALKMNLKALFAPKEEATFSLVNYLDLDLELELDADIFGSGARSGTSQENGHPSQPIIPTSQVVEIPATKSTAKGRSRVTLDPSQSLLFPTLDSLPHPYIPSNPTTTTFQHGTPSCFLFSPLMQVRGSHHLPSNITFTRSSEDTPESIRERWEKSKSSLTREWKKAWREARGSRRGKFGTGAEIGGGS